MRLLASLEAMAEVGLQPDGSICRRGFTAEDRQGRERLSEWMIDAGLSLRIDAAGNLIGRLEGSDPSLPALVTGSHLDTVPTGGRYDGTLGVLAGLEVVRALQDAALQLRHPFELIVFADEESTMVGCKGMAGTASADPSDYTTSNGEPIERNLARLGAIGTGWPALPARMTRLRPLSNCTWSRAPCSRGVETALVLFRALLANAASRSVWAVRRTTPAPLRWTSVRMPWWRQRRWS